MSKNKRDLVTLNTYSGDKSTVYKYLDDEDLSVAEAVNEYFSHIDYNNGSLATFGYVYNEEQEQKAHLFLNRACHAQMCAIKAGAEITNFYTSAFTSQNPYNTPSQDHVENAVTWCKFLTDRDESPWRVAFTGDGVKSTMIYRDNGEPVSFHIYGPGVSNLNLHAVHSLFVMLRQVTERPCCIDLFADFLNVGKFDPYQAMVLTNMFRYSTFDGPIKDRFVKKRGDQGHWTWDSAAHKSLLTSTLKSGPVLYRPRLTLNSGGNYNGVNDIWYQHKNHKVNNNLYDAIDKHSKGNKANVGGLLFKYHRPTYTALEEQAYSMSQVIEAAHNNIELLNA